MRVPSAIAVKLLVAVVLGHTTAIPIFGSFRRKGWPAGASSALTRVSMPSDIL